MTSAAATKRRLFAPEVVQASMMDCGPASLKCLLDGFGLPVNYGRLREACQTSVDGTSIDVMEEVAVQLGLDAVQVMVPTDHVLAPEAGVLPAIVVVKLPGGVPHFVVVWRRHGRLLQVMDPGVGRRWVTAEAFLAEVYEHRTHVPAEAWREYAASDEFVLPLMRRIVALGARRSQATELIGRAGDSWRGLAALDAATRMLEAVARANGIDRGRPILAMLERLMAPEGAATIPLEYWSARPAPVDAEGNEQVGIRGAVLVSARGRAEGAVGRDADAAQARPLSPELVAAMREGSRSPLRELFDVVRENGLFEPAALVGAVVCAAAAMLVEALLLRALLDLGWSLGIAPQRLGSMGVLLVFLTAMLLVQARIADGLWRVGRKLEIALRVRFFRKIPRIGDQYFHSRLLSDMAERAHAIPELRRATGLAYDLTNGFSQLVFTTAGLIWLEPRSGPAAALVAVTVVATAYLSQSILNERDLRARSHGAAISRYFLDALMGLVPVRAHGAERALAREQEAVLVQWTESKLRLQRAAIAAEGIEALVAVLLSVWLVFGHVTRAGGSGSVLLFAYWALRLPALGQELALAARQVPALRNVMLRLLEPLGAPEAAVDPAAAAARPEGAAPPAVEGEVRASQGLGATPAVPKAPPAAAPARGVRIEMRGVGVSAGGHTLIEGADLALAAAAHVAVVGASGAGKSTLLGLLLGWHRPAGGEILVDGEPLSPERVVQLRRYTAWVDPTITLYNRRFIDNLSFSRPHSSPHELGWAIDAAELREVVERLPDGLQTVLGEGGALVSGGEGQRLRLGRAMLATDARLVLLDEPFRGLDRETRQSLLTRARSLWKNATLLCVTHDVAGTLSFPRVLVIDKGRIVEDGEPGVLRDDANSLYAQLLTAERQVREGLWASAAWRRIRIERGRIVESPARGPVAPDSAAGGGRS